VIGNNLYIFCALIFSVTLTSCFKISVGYHTEDISDPDSVITKIGGLINEDQIGLHVTHCNCFGEDGCKSAKMVQGSEIWVVRFAHTTDFLKLDTIIESVHFFTCKGFEEKYKNNKNISVLLSYDIDSNGVKLHRRNSYSLKRRENVIFSIH